MSYFQERFLAKEQWSSALRMNVSRLTLWPNSSLQVSLKGCNWEYREQRIQCEDYFVGLFSRNEQISLFARPLPSWLYYIYIFKHVAHLCKHVCASCPTCIPGCPRMNATNGCLMESWKREYIPVPIPLLLPFVLPRVSHKIDAWIRAVGRIIISYASAIINIFKHPWISQLNDWLPATVRLDRSCSFSLFFCFRPCVSFPLKIIIRCHSPVSLLSLDCTVSCAFRIPLFQ